MRFQTAAALLSTVLALAACGGGASPELNDARATKQHVSPSPESSHVVVPIPTWDSPASGEGSEAAAVEGILNGSMKGDELCLWLESTDGPRREAVRWPEGFTGARDPIRIFDASGALVATEGDKVLAAGGKHTAESDSCLVGNGRDQVWHIGYVHEVSSG